MAALPYIQLYVADYLADTAHLSVTASGAYLHLIMNYWQRGKPLTNSDDGLAMIAKCYNGEWPNVKRDVLEFFEERDGLLYHSRIEKDLRRVAGRDENDTYLTDEWRGYVYFISNAAFTKVKIGYSKNPWARVKDLQTGNSDQLILRGVLRTTDPSEKKLHAELEEYRVGREWFEASSIIKGLIGEAKSKRIDTLDEAVNYCRNYGITTVATTKDTDTDTDTDTEDLSTSNEVDVGISDPDIPQDETDDSTRATDEAQPEGGQAPADRNPCPLKRIVELYHQSLPELPRVEKLTKVRAGYIQQRWREDLPHEDAWRSYFADVRRSRFLMGMTQGRDGKPPFRADLEWLTRPGNFAKVAEGKYHS